jgi:addiction module HigA family antidote
MKFSHFANPFHPGELLLEEFLQPKKLTQLAFAKKVGWSPRRLNEVIRGKRAITANSALDLAEVLGTTPEFWLNLQMTYELAQAREARKVA